MTSGTTDTSTFRRDINLQSLKSTIRTQVSWRWKVTFFCRPWFVRNFLQSIQKTGTVSFYFTFYEIFRYIYAGDYRGGYNLWDLHSKELNVQKYTSEHFNIRNRCNLVRDVDWHPHLPVLAASRYASKIFHFIIIFSWNGTVTFWTRKASNYESLCAEDLSDMPIF